MVLPSRSQLIRDSDLTQTDLLEIATCRGEPQCLGFAYQLGFVQVFQRFPVQQPLARIDHRFGNEGDFGRPERFSESFAIDPVQVE